MNRNYDKKLVELIKNNQYIEPINDIDVLIKPIPDGKHEGQMDPRAYKQFRMMALMSRILPKKMMEMNLDEKNLPKIRKMFNNVDSHPMVSDKLEMKRVNLKTHDNDEISMMIYRKNKEETNRPILYYIHGGGFFAGRTEVVEEAMKLLVVKYNITVFSINYRLAPEHPFPLGHKDTYTGLKWVIEHAEEYGADKNNIFIAGDSAGGTLTQYCTNQSLKDDLDNVKGQILLYPALNLSTQKDENYDFNFDKLKVYPKHKRAIDMAMGMLDGSMSDLGELLGIKDVLNPDISPYFGVHKDNPPTLLSVGEFDFLRHETIAFAKKLIKNGTEVKTILYRGLAHAYIDQVGNFPQSEDMIDEMGEFIINHVKK